MQSIGKVSQHGAGYASCLCHYCYGVAKLADGAFCRDCTAASCVEPWACKCDKLRADEKLTQDERSGSWIAEYECRDHVGHGEYVHHWERLGTYGSRDEAMRALHAERREFTASYGGDWAAGVE
jgi:hypothetical protein